MIHKAFRFNWNGFDEELRDLLDNALMTNNPSQLVIRINSALNDFSGPYEGEPLTPNWMEVLNDCNDVHEIGDYVLTRFYQPINDCGIGDAWTDIDDRLDIVHRHALLGRTIGPAKNPFDPGKMGSYFQTTSDVAHSLLTLRGLNDQRLDEFTNLLNKCVSSGDGVYVTF